MNNKGCKALCIALAACPKIQALNVSWNNIGARSMYRLGDAISNSTTIQKLDLSYNSLNDEGGVVFGAFLACCKSLIHINCTENRLGPNSAYAIATVYYFSHERLIIKASSTATARFCPFVLPYKNMQSLKTTFQKPINHTGIRD